jgi:hypothetical protein
MGDIISINGEERFSSKREDEVRLSFLVDEGLELLSLYREVRNDAVRRSILGLLRSVVEAENAANPAF